MQVSNDLSDVKSLEGEGAYFRVLRHLWLNGPQPIEQIKRKCQHTFTELEHLFNTCSSTDEHLFSVKWLEEQRTKADAWRDNKRKAGIQSATVRASKSKRKNRRSTTVEHPTSISTSISTLTQERKEHARDEKFESLWTTFERYGAKGKAMAYWQRLTQEDRDTVLANAPAYVASTPGCEFRKQLEGWINPDNRLWERPIRKNTTIMKPEHSAQRKNLKTTWD